MGISDNGWWGNSTKCSWEVFSCQIPTEGARSASSKNPCIRGLRLVTFIRPFLRNLDETAQFPLHELSRNLKRNCRHILVFFNTLWTGDADLRLYITTVQDGWRKSAFLTRAWFSRTTHLITQYMEHFSEWSRWRMFIRGLELVATIYLQLI